MCNLDRPDGYRCYWRDLRKKPKYFTKRKEGSLMVWGAISSSGCLELQYPFTPMYSTEYITVLSFSLLVFLRKNNEKQYVFQ